MNNNKNLILNQSKQELAQADSKLGWLATIYALIVSSILAVIIGANGTWMIYGWFLALPISSLLIVLAVLIPMNVKNPRTGIASAPMNPFEYNESDIYNSAKSIPDSSKIDFTISVNYTLSKRKYKFAKASAWYLLPVLYLIDIVYKSTWK